jgi:ankyrin repeat protein
MRFSIDKESNSDLPLPLYKENFEDDGSRPIHFAAYHGNRKLIDILMNSGADPTLSNKQNLNVLHMAAQGDSPYSLILFKSNFKDIF